MRRIVGLHVGRLVRFWQLFSCSKSGTAKSNHLWQTCVHPANPFLRPLPDGSGRPDGTQYKRNKQKKAYKMGQTLARKL